MPTLTTGHEIYAEKAIEGLTRGLAPLRKFSLDFSNEAKQPGEAINVQLVQPDPAAPFNPVHNNFNRVVTKFHQARLTFPQPKISGFAVTSEQALNFRPSWWESKAELNTQELCDGALVDVAALINGTNYGDKVGDKIEMPLATFNQLSIAAIRSAAIKKKLRPNRSTLCLHPDYFSKLLGDLDANVYGGREAIIGGAIPGLLGFATIVEMPQLTVPGFVAQSDAIACAARVFRPVRDTPYDIVQEIVEPVTGVVVAHIEYMDGPSGNLSDNVTLLFTTGVGNKDALLRIVD